MLVSALDYLFVQLPCIFSQPSESSTSNAEQQALALEVDTLTQKLEASELSRKESDEIASALRSEICFFLSLYL